MTIRVVFTGKLSMTRDQAEEHASRAGLHVSNKVDSSTTHLVIGGRPGNTKLKAAQRYGVTKINESEYLALAAGGTPPQKQPPPPTQGAAEKQAPRRRKKKMAIEKRPDWLEGMRNRPSVVKF